MSDDASDAADMDRATRAGWRCETRLLAGIMIIAAAGDIGAGTMAGSVGLVGLAIAVVGASGRVDAGRRAGAASRRMDGRRREVERERMAAMMKAASRAAETPAKDASVAAGIRPTWPTARSGR